MQKKKLLNKNNKRSVYGRLFLCVTQKIHDLKEINLGISRWLVSWESKVPPPMPPPPINKALLRDY